MQAVITTVKGQNILTVTVPMQEPTLSTSGKSLVVATTGGNKTSAALVDGKPVTIGVNAYIPVMDKGGNAAAGIPAKVTEEKGVKFMTVSLPMQAPSPSSSGKTLVVATTGGNKDCTATVNGKTVKIGINAYIKA